MVIYDSYFTEFNQIIQDELEEAIILTYPELRQECPNCYLDTIGVSRSVSIYKVGGPEPFESGMPCPHCDGKGYKAVEQTESIPGRVYITAKDFMVAGNLMIPRGSIEFHCRHNYYPQLVMAKYSKPDNELIDYVSERYYLVGRPNSTGFVMNPVKHITSYWSLNGKD